MASIGWLHITDLHQGQAGQRGLLQGVKQDLLDDLGRLHDRSGPWQVVLFTGDLTQRALPEEFLALNDTLGALWEKMRALGSTPALFPVPGNHDLARPKAMRPEARVMKGWTEDADLQTEFWTTPASPYRALVEESFAGFSAWLASHPLPRLDVTPGLLPGEGAVVLEREGLRLGLVGLNTAFLQLADGDYTGRLDLHPDQLHAPCGGDGRAWVRGCHAAFLLTHHPPDWLSPAGKQSLNAEIAPPGSFTAHLFGHMHEHRAETRSVGGAEPVRLWQGRSLFGLEGWGTAASRLHGYSAGRLSVDAGGEASLRIWPREARRHQYGQWQIVPDYSFTLQDDGGTAAERLTLRLAPPPARPPTSASRVSSAGSEGPGLSRERCAQLIQLADEVHDDEVRKATRQLLSGEFVALQGPEGFQVSRALRALAVRCRERPEAEALRVTPVPLAPTMDEWLDYLARSLRERLPGAGPTLGGNRLFSLLNQLKDGVAALHDQGRRLVVVVDPVERFVGEQRERLVALLQVFAQLAEDRAAEPELESLGVAVAGGEDLHRILTGQVDFSADLSPFRASALTTLDPVEAPAGADDELRRVIDAVGGHPELLRWAAGRGGRIGGQPEADLPFLAAQVGRFREAPYREQLQRLLRGDAAAWDDPDPALRWSGWLRVLGKPGWLGPVLQELAARTLEGGGP